MKKFILLLVLVASCCTAVQAQRYYIPRYKRQKEVRDYDLSHPDRKLTITLGSTFDFGLGMQNRIVYDNDPKPVTYDENPELAGVTVTLGAGYRLGEHLVAGVEAGYGLTNRNNTIPVYGSFKWYYGKSHRQHRTRWFNYLNVGPQFYTSSKYHTVGAVGGIGGGLRVLAANSLRMDFVLGYRLGLVRPKVNSGGTYDIPASAVDHKQFLHGIQIGFNIVMF